MFHKAFAKSVIRHGLIIYGSAIKTTLSSIDSAQRRILRAIYFKKILTPCLTFIAPIVKQRV